jgi:hypothetical protein
MLHRCITKRSERFPADLCFGRLPTSGRKIVQEISPELYTTKPQPLLDFTNSGLFIIIQRIKGSRTAEVNVLVVGSLFSYKKINY